MSFINNNLFGTSPFEAGTSPGFEGEANPGAPYPPATYGQPDNVAPSPWSAPWGGAAGAGSPGVSNVNGLMSGVMNMLSNLMSQLGSLFGQAGGTSAASAANCSGSNCAGGGTAGQQFFTSATAGSTGDPHDSFDGSTQGGRVAGKWDNMSGHADLLSSNSFAGGYRVSTTTTQPNQKGVTYNATATVTTNGGGSSVSMNADGSYEVSAYGQNVTLQQGQAVQLGGGASVALNADGSLTVADQNASGGSLQTTLRSNGDGGVDVSSTARDVDLGGYLAHKGDDPSGPPRRQPLQQGYQALGEPPVLQPWSPGVSWGSANSSSDFAAALDGSDLTQFENVGLL